MVEDTEINIICEFAKLYLDGVRPTIERPHGEYRDRLKDVFREHSSISGDVFHLSEIEFIIDGEDWL